jgi:Tfp pilus assembly protein PilW
LSTSNEDEVTPDWTITESQWNDMIEDEISYVFFKVIDALGNTFITSSTSNAMRVRKNIEEVTEFTLDVKDFDTWQWDNSYNIRVNTQNTSIANMTLWYRFSGEDKNTSSNWTRYDKSLNTTPFEWNFKPEDGEGYYQFYVEVNTAEGLTKTTAVQIIYITMFPIIELVVALVITIILFTISGLVIRKYRGNKRNKSI